MSIRRLFLALLPLLALTLAAHAQARGRFERSASPRLATPGEVELVLRGTVFTPGGAPAAGVVVASSAGGRAVTSADGTFRFALPVAGDAAEVRLVAVDRVGLRATARVALAPAALPAAPHVTLRLAAGTPTPQWLPTFGSSPATETLIEALVAFEVDGEPMLIAGGSFLRMGHAPAQHIAAWDGEHWRSIGSMDAEVLALAVYDAGDGPRLVAAGSFLNAGGVAANHIASWDGEAWEPLLGGVSEPVQALTVYDFGNGPELYAAASLGSSGQIQRYNGHFWVAVAGALNGTPSALVGFDDGGGPALYAGGNFTMVDGAPIAGVARWDGFAWNQVGTTVTSLVEALAVFDDGNGPRLFVGGQSFLARWIAPAWDFLSTGLHVEAFELFDDGGGTALYATGDSTPLGGGTGTSLNLVRWDGTSLTTVAAEPTVHDQALAVFDDGAGPRLCVGGQPAFNTQEPNPSISSWDGSTWESFGPAPDDAVRALVSFDDGGGPALFVAGEFRSAGHVASYLGKWDGAEWAAVPGLDRPVAALQVFDDGGGAALIAGGNFLSAGAVPGTRRVAKWDGAAWSALGTGMDNEVACFEVFDAGAGPELYAAGAFLEADGQPANRIAKWDGTSWVALGSGLNRAVFALSVFDDGNGPDLYVGGRFAFAGGLPVSRIARWDGSAWSSLGVDLPGSLDYVSALHVFDDGGGAALYVGGQFQVVNGQVFANVAKWDGTAWFQLGSGMFGAILDFASHDDGNGSALFAGGTFSSAGGLLTNRIAKWDGSQWSPLGSGVEISISPQPFAIRTLCSAQLGPDTDLFVGGAFYSAPDSGDSLLARWGVDEQPPVITCPGDVTALDRANDGPGQVVTFVVEATDDIAAHPLVVCTPPSGSLFPRGTTTVTCTATDGSGNQATCQFDVVVRTDALEAPRSQP